MKYYGKTQTISTQSNHNINITYTNTIAGVNISISYYASTIINNNYYHYGTYQFVIMKYLCTHIDFGQKARDSEDVDTMACIRNRMFYGSPNFSIINILSMSGKAYLYFFDGILCNFLYFRFFVSGLRLRIFIFFSI